MTTPSTVTGESWLWDGASGRVGTRVAVDLGQVKGVGEQVALSQPNIVVLTHDDLDHIGGWNGFAHALDPVKDWELWVPFDWAALIAVAEALAGDDRSDTPLPDDVETLLAEVASEFGVESEVWRDGDWVRRRVTEARDAFDQFVESGAAIETLGRIAQDRSRGDSDETIGTPRQVGRRLVKRGRTLIRIIESALSLRAVVRFFSVDQVDFRRLEPWSFVGTPGIATIANAREAGLPPRWRYEPVSSLAAVLELSVQNRRALCPVLWSRGSVRGGAMIWSDSSGEWLRAVGAFPITPLVAVHSAPHHASANAAHDAIWAELSRRDRDSLVVCAGGMRLQDTHPDFLAIDHRSRACTLCRHPRVARASHGFHVELCVFGCKRLSRTCPR